MLHLLKQVRPPIDAFEVTLLNAFSNLRSVEAIWIREVNDAPCGLKHPHPTVPSCAGVVPRRYTRAVWLQLRGRSLGDHREIQARTQELLTRTTAEHFGVEVRVIVDDLPPAAIAPSCIFRRGSGDV
jgi:hypothetical protein